MKLGYNTNGLAHHRLTDAIELVAELGYQAVALTIDHGALDPFEERSGEQLLEVRRLLQERGLACVVETGGRFLLDRWQKHEPTLVSPNSAARQRRIEFLKYAVEVAAALEADCVSLWAGVVHDGAGRGEALDRLVAGLVELLPYAADKNVSLGFEPEPGMLVDTMPAFQALLERLEAAGGDADALLLTLDFGHLHCQGELPIADQIRQWRERLVNVHIEDMRQAAHDHLMFGEGEIDFPPVIAALAEIGYGGPVNVELSRHSHMGPAAAQQAYAFLQPLVDSH